MQKSYWRNYGFQEKEDYGMYLMCWWKSNKKPSFLPDADFSAVSPSRKIDINVSSTYNNRIRSNDQGGFITLESKQILINPLTSIKFLHKMSPQNHGLKSRV